MPGHNMPNHGDKLKWNPEDYDDDEESLINTFAFIMNDNWKHYIKEFDKLPRYKNIIGTWVVIIIVAFILVNAVISFKTMSEIVAHRPK